MHSPAALIARITLCVMLNMCALGFIVAYIIGLKNATTGIILCVVVGWCIKPDLAEFESMLDRLREHRKQGGQS